MSNRNRTPRTAALLLSIAVGGASLTMLPAAEAAPHAAVASVQAKAVTVETVVKRLSSAKGVAGDTVLIQGEKLATGTAGNWTKKVVKFGETTVDAADVTVLSARAIVVEVPAGANGSVLVVVGDAVKGPKFTYAAPITITTDQDDLDTFSEDLVSETGLAGQELVGTNFTKATKILIGGKAAKVAKEGNTASKITFDFPAGLIGVQDVTVVDGGKTYYLGYVTYTGKPVTITGVTGTSYKEQASALEVAGTNLDLVTGVTYNGVKAGFKVTKGVSNKLAVTIPAGDVVTDGDLVVTTKYEATASYEVDRVAAPVPAVSAVSTVTPATVGEVTLTGTNLTGLKKVVVKNAAGKAFAGSKITVTNATTAKVTLPALVAGTYTISVTAISATASSDFSFTVGAPAAPVPTLTEVSYDASVDPDPAVLTLEGTNLEVGQEVRYYTGAASSAASVSGQVVVEITGAGSATLASVELADDLAAGTYQVQIKTGATTWSTAVELVVS